VRFVFFLLRGGSHGPASEAGVPWGSTQIKGETMGKQVFRLFLICVILALGTGITLMVIRSLQEKKVLEQVIQRLHADSRIAEVLVTNVQYDQYTNKRYTTIKFLEYDTNQKPLKARYFTFAGNIIQFQSLVVRFDDALIRKADALRGKSVYLFLKVFLLDGPNTQEYVLSDLNGVPTGYTIGQGKNLFEEKIWKRFWSYTVSAAQRKSDGVKNAQIEAPGTVFIPGMLYTIKIEHDGGMRIDSTSLPEILKGEKIAQ